MGKDSRKWKVEGANGKKVKVSDNPDKIV